MLDTLALGISVISTAMQFLNDYLKPASWLPPFPQPTLPAGTQLPMHLILQAGTDLGVEYQLSVGKLYVSLKISSGHSLTTDRESNGLQTVVTTVQENTQHTTFAAGFGDVIVVQLLSSNDSTTTTTVTTDQTQRITDTDVSTPQLITISVNVGPATLGQLQSGSIGDSDAEITTNQSVTDYDFTFKNQILNQKQVGSAFVGASLQWQNSVNSSTETDQDNNQGRQDNSTTKTTDTVSQFVADVPLVGFKYQSVSTNEVSTLQELASNQGTTQSTKEITTDSNTLKQTTYDLYGNYSMSEPESGTVTLWETDVNGPQTISTTESTTYSEMQRKQGNSVVGVVQLQSDTTTGTTSETETQTNLLDNITETGTVTEIESEVRSSYDIVGPYAQRVVQTETGTASRTETNQGSVDYAAVVSVQSAQTQVESGDQISGSQTLTQTDSSSETIAQAPDHQPDPDWDLLREQHGQRRAAQGWQQHPGRLLPEREREQHRLAW